MRACVCRLAATAAFMLVVNAAAAQDKIRIGLIYTLSGSPSALGQQSKNGFELALKNLGGKMGGKDVELVVADDELKPDVAIQKVRGLLERDRVDFVVGPIFSNILVAIHKPVIDAGKILISTNAGTSNFAGAGCNANFFVTSYQNDQIFEAVGEASNKLGYKRVYVLVPNYPAGKDAIAGFKRTYKGEIIEESLLPLNTTDSVRKFPRSMRQSRMHYSLSCRAVSVSIFSIRIFRRVSKEKSRSCLPSQPMRRHCRCLRTMPSMSTAC